MGLDFVSGKEPRTELCTIPCKADNGDPQNQHGNPFVHTYVSTKLVIVSLYLFSFIFDSYLATAIFCSASERFSETCCFLTSLCVYSVSFLFICLNLLTENKDIIVLDQWSICSRKLFRVVLSTRCFLRKHPHGQNTEHPQ